MRLAFLGDIHGNLPALESVLADLEQQSPDAIYLLGDQVNRCGWDNEVMDLVADQGWPAIRGNHEWILGRLNTPDNPSALDNRVRFATLWWTWAQLSERHLETIRALPAQRRLDFGIGPPICLLHGTPDSPFVGLFPHDDEITLASTLADISEPIVVAAHTHWPMARKAGRWQIFNGGSVGMPYNGDPRGQYLLLDLAVEKGTRCWKPTFRQAAYDRTCVQNKFENLGLVASIGRIAELHLRTVMDGEPWASDFNHWVKSQPAEIRDNPDRAVGLYLEKHGPDQWSFRSTA